MKKQVWIALIVTIAFTFTNILYIPSTVSAQNIITLGEINTYGEVFIKSSTGQWKPSKNTYPLLQNTAIRTDDGVASIFFRDDSRVNISKETIAVINGSASDYSIALAKGIIAFNIKSSSLLTITTKSTTIQVNNEIGIVQKVSYEKPQRSLGAVSVNEKGTEIINISGIISSSISPSETKLINAGESIFIGSDNKIYKVEAIKPIEERYKIRSGDLLKIETEEFQGTVRVDEQGNISFPGPGDDTYHVEGLTTYEVEYLISEKLEKPLEKTFVTVIERKKVAPLIPAEEVAAAKSLSTKIAVALAGLALVGLAIGGGGGGGGGSRIASPSVP